MVNTELRPGNAHSNSAGSKEFIEESVKYAKKMVKSKILVVMDSGFDSQELIRCMSVKNGVDFIVKHNLRREPVKQWYERAKEEAREREEFRTKRERGIIYRGSIRREIKDTEEKMRMVYEVKEITHKNNRRLIVPEVRVGCYWTSLDLEEIEVIKLYRERGTSEQYHAEFKTEMDMKRLPSGKFKVNRAFLLLGMLVYNMLRVISSDMVLAKALSIKKRSRRRVKTVIRSVIFMAGRIIRHARNTILQISCPDKWYEFFSNLFMRLQVV